MEHILLERKRVCDYYDTHLDFSTIKKLKIRAQTQWNYSYYPIIFKTESQLLKIKAKLEEQHIFPRRYFYPSLDKLNYVKQNSCPISQDIACRVLCLPLYVGLLFNDIRNIVDVINDNKM